MSLPDHHLDLGCGLRPRNPYGRARLSGVDIRPLSATAEFDYRVANLALDPVPFADDTFGSVSAFDFIEHVPRILTTPDGRATVFPFVRLMQEVWRVLAPGGLLYALTPAFPNPEAFVDPTHVNIITDQTHDYFCGEEPVARMYGFGGRFRARRAEWVHVVDAYSAIAGSPENRKPPTAPQRMARGLRSVSRVLRGRTSRDRKVYFLWELEAVKGVPVR
jgi:SAM-dependent methyltransferase